MALIRRLTGPGVSERINMVSADLGIVRWDPKRGANAVVFGDNFPERYMRGSPWQSPSIAMYDKEFNLLGIPAGHTEIISSGNRRQALDYEHNAGGISTILPCDLIRLEGRWVMACMIVGMGGLGNELATQFWQSADLITWVKFGPSLEHPGHPGNVMLTFDKGADGFVYIFGTGGLARNRPVYMWRCPAGEFPLGYWEPYGLDQVGWAWGNANERTPVLPGRYGELSFRFIQGNAVLSFFDVDRYTCSALCAKTPTDYWPGANRVDYAHGHQHPQLYGGYIAEDSKLSTPDGMKFVVSQWNTQSNDPYWTLYFTDTLDAAGPIVETTPEPEPAPEPEPEEPIDVPETAQGTYELLLRELAASGSTQILTSDGRALTLREAVGEIYESECALQDLRGFPRHPSEPGPQLDHILSGRSEGLLTQALVYELAKKAGVEVDRVYAAVRRSIG